MADAGYIMCVLWGEQSVASVQMTCCKCLRPVALDKKNSQSVDSRGLKPVCMSCVAKMKGGWEYAGSLVGGEEIHNWDEATLKAAIMKAQYQRRN